MRKMITAAVVVATLIGAVLLRWRNRASIRIRMRRKSIEARTQRPGWRRPVLWRLARRSISPIAGCL